MSQTPKVSIIVPVYNAEKYLHRCVDSILNQTLRDIEIILVNDGSTDDCAQICDNYAATDLRVRVIHQKNAGPATARNKGLQAAQGEWIWFIDADDRCELDACKNILAHAGKSTDILLFGSNIYIKNQLNPSPYFSLYTVKNVDSFNIDSRPDIITSVPATLWNKFFRRDFLCTQHIFLDESLHLCDDNLFSLAAYLQAREIRIIQGNFYNYYKYNETSISSSAVHWQDVISCSEKQDALVLASGKTQFYNFYVNRNINGLFFWMDNLKHNKRKFYNRLHKYFNALNPKVYNFDFLYSQTFYTRFLNIKRHNYFYSKLFKNKRTDKWTEIYYFGSIPLFKCISTPIERKKYVFGICISRHRLAQIHRPAISPSSARKWRKLKNKFAEKKRLFIIGNGPSVKHMDLSPLNEEYTFVVSRGYLLKKQGLRHASFYCISDRSSYENYGNEIDLNFADFYFASTWTGWNKCPQKSFLFDLAINVEISRNHCFQFDLTAPLILGRTVVLDALQIAVYLGFKEIYFIGVDLDFTPQERHFYTSNATEQLPQHITWAIENTPKMLANFKTANELLQPLGIHLYNAGIGGQLDALPRVNFTSLFQSRSQIK